MLELIAPTCKSRKPMAYVSESCTTKDLTCSHAGMLLDGREEGTVPSRTAGFVTHPGSARSSMGLQPMSSANIIHPKGSLHLLRICAASGTLLHARLLWSTSDPAIQTITLPPQAMQTPRTTMLRTQAQLCHQYDLFPPQALRERPGASLACYVFAEESSSESYKLSIKQQC